MRAFHFSWIGFFVAFFIWFAIAPLLGEIRTTLGLTKQQIWNSSIISVAGTVFLRFVLGPVCDKYGARVPMGALLMCCSIPVACTGAVNSATGLYFLRFFIGLAGASFVMCQAWCTRMFTKEVAGTANGIAAGWGNLGGGVTQLIMGSVLFPLFKLGMSAELAWRTVCLVPAFVAFVVGALLMKYSDDFPQGNYLEMKKAGTMPKVSATTSFRVAAKNFNTWLLFFQYACCFGVELTMDNAAALYFTDVFGKSTESAAAIASIFGWMNIFARGLGGYISDRVNRNFGMRGRLWVQFTCLFMEGLMIIAFAHETKNLGISILILTVFSLFVEAGCGTSFGIVPYVIPSSMGSVSGIVGAGGNVGAVCFGLAFRQLDYYWAFIIMGCVVIVAALSTVFIFIDGHAGLLCGRDSPTLDKQRASVTSTDFAIEDDTTNEDFSNRGFSNEQIPNKDVSVEDVPNKEG